MYTRAAARKYLQGLPSHAVAMAGESLLKKGTSRENRQASATISPKTNTVTSPPVRARADNARRSRTEGITTNIIRLAMFSSISIKHALFIRPDLRNRAKAPPSHCVRTGRTIHGQGVGVLSSRNQL